MSSSTTRMTGTSMALVSCWTLRLSSMYLTIEMRMRALPCQRKMRSMLGVRIAGDEVLDLAVIVGQHHHGHVEPGGLDLARQLRGVHVGDLQVGDDQVEARLRARQLQRFCSGGDVGHAGNLVQVQLQRLADQQLVEAAVLAQDEGVVEAGDQQDVVHAERHQVLEAFEQAFGLGRGIGCWSGGTQSIFALR